MYERARCHGGETNCCCSSTCLEVCAECPPPSQPLENLTVKLAIDGLTREYEFLVDNALDIEKMVNMGLTLLRT